jgi:hypothetical protein
MDGFMSQIFWISETFVRWLLVLNVRLPARFVRVHGWPMPGELQLSEPQLPSVKLPKT